MPKLPTHIVQSEARGSLRIQPNIGRRGAGLGDLGEGLGRVAEVLLLSEEQEAAADASQKLQIAKRDWGQKLVDRFDEVEPGAPDFTPNFMKEYDEFVEETVATGKTRAAQDFLRARLTENGTMLAGQAKTLERDEKIRHRDSQLDDSLNLVRSSAEINPDGYQTGLAEYLGVLDQMVMPPTERAARRQVAIQSTEESAAVGYARRDPEGALKRLTAPAAEDRLFRELSPKARARVMDEYESFQRLRLAAEDRAYRDAERTERDVQDATSKQGDRLLADGKLTPTWIEANRERLSADDFRYYYRSLSETGKDGPRNAALYAELRERAGQGQDVRAEARAGLLNGEFSASDFDRIVGEVEGQRPGWYKRGVSYLTGASGYSDLNPTPDRGLLKANMLDDWQDWASANPKASDDDANKAYRRIASEYALIDRDKVSLTLRRPMFMADRNNPNLDAVEAQTVQAYEKGEIDRAEFERQAELLNRWREAYRPAAPPQ